MPKSKILGRQLAKRKQKVLQSSSQQDDGQSVVNFVDNNTPDIFNYSRTDMQNKKIKFGQTNGSIEKDFPG